MLHTFKAYQLAKTFHLACKRVQVTRPFRDQFFRASSSIVLNVAEGAGKRTSADQRKFYGIALGSLRECQAILDIEEVQDAKLSDRGNQVGAILYALSTKPN